MGSVLLFLNFNLENRSVVLSQRDIHKMNGKYVIGSLVWHV